MFSLAKVLLVDLFFSSSHHVKFGYIWRTIVITFHKTHTGRNLKSFIRLRKSLVVITVLYLLAVILLGSIALVGLHTGVPLEKLTRDTTAVAGVNPFTGVISNLGILCWCAAASVCLFCFFDISDRRNYKINDYTLFLLFFGLTTLALLLDDLFLFHEVIAPKILNIPEEIILPAYGITVLYGIVKFKRIIFQTEWIILSLAFAFFALSIAIDFLENFLTVPSSIFIEDSFKFLGIISWVYYFVLASFQIEKKFSK